MMTRQPILSILRDQNYAEFYFPEETFEMWSIRFGVSPKSGMPVSRIGLYTDFT